MTQMLLAVFTSSLLGSLHCAGMCGGLVGLYSCGACPGRDRRGSLGGHLGYNGGRLLSYAVLGALAGGIGKGLDLASELAGAAPLATLLTGVLILGIAAARMSSSLGVSPQRQRRSSGWHLTVVRLGQVASGGSPTARGLRLGLVSAFIPCGWLYAFLLAAMGSGSSFNGGSLMLAFWCGTLPAMLGVGCSIGIIGDRLRGYGSMLGTSALIIVGIVTLVHRGGLPMFPAAAIHGPSGTPAATSAQAPCHEPRAEAGQ